MKMQQTDTEVVSLVQAHLDRRRFFRQAGMLGLGIAASGFAVESAFAKSEAAIIQAREQNLDTVQEIFTAALIAEDLATTFYYNALVGPVIQDVNLAGLGGSATDVKSSGNFGNVAYVRAALTEEISHAKLLRSLLGIPSAAADPVQTFYFPAGSFATLGAFTGLLDALENAFIGAYLNAIQELAHKAARLRVAEYRDHLADHGRDDDASDGKYTSIDLEYFAKVAASIMGVECEHRALGRVISNTNPANNRNYEVADGINAVYNGKHSAVVALTPFLTASTGPAYSFAEALAGQGKVSQPVTGAPPSF